MATTKDADMSPFEAGRRLLSGESARMSLGDKTELVFQDMDLVPLLVQVAPLLVSTSAAKRHQTTCHVSRRSQCLAFLRTSGSST